MAARARKPTEVCWRPGFRLVLFEDFFHQSKRLLLHLVWEQVSAIRMLHLQAARGFVKSIYFAGFGVDRLDTLPLEIGVTVWRVDEEITGRKATGQLVKIKRQIGEWVIEQARHIALTGPAANVAIHVISERIEAAT